MEKLIQRGDLFFANLALGAGSEQCGARPVLVIQNNFGNQHSPTVIAALLTTKPRQKARQPTHCVIKAQQGLRHDSTILLEQLRTIDKSRLSAHIGTLDAQTMRRVDRALAVSVGLFDSAC